MVRMIVKRRQEQNKDCRPMPQNCIASLKTGNESMEILDRKLLLLRNTLDRTVASCQVELQEAEADCSFWRISCYVSESPPFLKSAKAIFSGKGRTGRHTVSETIYCKMGSWKSAGSYLSLGQFRAPILPYSDPLRVVSWRNRCVFL